VLKGLFYVIVSAIFSVLQGIEKRTDVTIGTGFRLKNSNLKNPRILADSQIKIYLRSLFPENVVIRGISSAG
jgi:hypothetical protein